VRVTSLARGPAGRRPVRLRLTLVYSGLFLLAGVVLLTVTYGVVASTLSTKNAGVGAPGPQLSASAGLGFAQSTFVALCKSGRVLTSNQEAKCQLMTAQALREAAQSGARTATANALSNLLDTSLAALGLTAVLSTALGWVVAGRALRPVHAITAAARRASEENLGERIALAGPPDELKELADTFDAMLARLDAAFASQHRFVANASHELRTPLTVMRTAIDVTLAKPERSPAQLEAMAVEVRDAAERAEALIEALLTLARSDRGTGIRAPLDMAVLAEDALDASAAAIGTARLRVATELVPGPAMGDPVLVERLVANLIDNAVRHNMPDGWISVATGSRNGMAFITVANGGPLIAAADAEVIFEPFRRLRPSTDGSAYPDDKPRPDGVGLGLSIVRSVVAAHGGKATARPGTSGGLELSVWLPTTA
jgi:signal transduction histidine kinase